MKTRPLFQYLRATFLLATWTTITALAVPTGTFEEAARKLRQSEDGKQLWLTLDAKTELKGDFIARLRNEAATGNAKAEATLALCHQVGFGVPRDMTKAVSGFQKAARAGHPGAQNNLGVLYDSGEGVPKDPVKAHELYLAAAAQRFADGQFNIGLNYANGIAVPQNWEKARAWYEKAAAQGQLAALHNLGNLFFFGRGVPVDYETARKCLKKPAESGLAMSQYSLAATYLAQKRFPEAAPWLRRSAEGGYPGGQFYWAAALMEGVGVAKDPAEALKMARRAVAGTTASLARMAPEAHALLAQLLLTTENNANGAEAFREARAAADAGDARGQHLLGVCYHRGAGVDRDVSTAVHWYRLAAAQKYPDSWSVLGILSEQGIGTTRDFAEAAKWYRLAGDSGNVIAMYRLGLFYRDGTGVETDLQESARWLRLGLRSAPNDPELKSALADVERQLKR